MASTNKSKTFTSPGSVNIPANARNVNYEVKSSKGGNGGGDASHDGGTGGNGRRGKFSTKSTHDFKSYTLTVWTSSNGSDGDKNTQGTGGGNGGSGRWDGGDGGDAAPYPYSGGGGGGGGAAAVRRDSSMMIIAGGGGGGGGASNENDGKNGGNAGSFSTSPDNGSNGGNGQTILSNPPGFPSSDNDGGGGGGGGAGAPSGGGGGGGSDYNFLDIRAEGGGGGGSYYRSPWLSKDLDSSWTGSSEVVITWQEITPEITSFYASPTTTADGNNGRQTSGNDGVPNYNATIYFTAKDFDTLTLTSNAGESWNVTSKSSQSITNLPQSTAGTTTRRKYTLTASIGGQSVSESIWIYVTNDRTFTNSWTTLFTGLEPITPYKRKIGTLSGTDMVVKISSGSTGVQFASSQNGSYNNPQYFNPGSDVYIKMTTKDFNTDLSMINGNSAFGSTNNKTVSVTVLGNSSFNVTYQTRAPRIKPSFDFDGNPGVYPHPDIDLISNNPKSTIETQTVQIKENKNDGIEIAVPIETDNSDIQIKLGNGSWQNIQEI